MRRSRHVFHGHVVSHWWYGHWPSEGCGYGLMAPPAPPSSSPPPPTLATPPDAPTPTPLKPYHDRQHEAQDNHGGHDPQANHEHHAVPQVIVPVCGLLIVTEHGHGAPLGCRGSSGAAPDSPPTA